MSRITVLYSEHSPSATQTIEILSRSGFEFREATKSDSVSCSGGDFLFALSYPARIPEHVSSLYKWACVLHGSKLPEGRGWSPVVWQALEGRTSFTMSLIKIDEKIDEGPVLLETIFSVDRAGLWDDFNQQIAIAQADLISRAIEIGADALPSRHQAGTPTYFRRRTPEDSRLDPTLSIEAQWDKIRTSDPNRYPAHFRLWGSTYEIIIRKRCESEN